MVSQCIGRQRLMLAACDGRGRPGSSPTCSSSPAATLWESLFRLTLRQAQSTGSRDPSDSATPSHSARRSTTWIMTIIQHCARKSVLYECDWMGIAATDMSQWRNRYDRLLEARLAASRLTSAKGSRRESEVSIHVKRSLFQRGRPQAGQEVHCAS